MSTSGEACHTRDGSGTGYTHLKQPGQAAGHNLGTQGKGTTWGHRARAQGKELWKGTGLRPSASIQLSTTENSRVGGHRLSLSEHM